MSRGDQAAAVGCILLALIAGCNRDRSPETSGAAATPVADALAAAPTAGATAVPGPEDEPQRSTLQLTLVGTVVREEPDKSMAAIRVGGALVARNFRPGQQVLEGVKLERVERQRILLRNHGVLEALPLARMANTAPTPASSPGPPRRTMPVPDGVSELRRSDVDRALRNTAALDSQLGRGQLDVEGKRLLIVTAVEPGTLFDLLGLREHDVLMQVDGEWINDQRNPLWDALRDRERVRLLVMRSGSPNTFEFVIQ